MFQKIKYTYQYYKQPLIVVSFAISLMMSIFSIHSIVNNTSLSNDECIWTEKKNENDSVLIVFGSVKLNGITYNAGIRNGDYLIAIGGTKLESIHHAAEVFNQYKAGETAIYTIQKKNGEKKDVKIYVKKLISFMELSNALLGLFWLLIGFIVILAKSDGKLQGYFYKIALSYIVSTFVSQYMTIRMGYIATLSDFLLISINYTLLSFSSYWFIIFFALFPRKHRFIDKQWFRPTLLYITIGILLYAEIILLTQIFDRKVVEINLGLAGYFLGIYSKIGLVTGLVLLSINYFRIKVWSERKQVLYILITYALTVISIIYIGFIAPSLFAPIFNSPELYLPIFLSVLFPISFAVSIFKYQLLDVSIVVKNTIVYGVATLSLALIYFLSIYGLGLSLGQVVADEYRNVVVALSFVVFAFVFQSTKDKFQDLLTKRFYPEQFVQQRILIDFNKDLTNIVGLDNILDNLFNTFVNTLKINKFGIMLRENNNVLKMVRSVGILRENLEIDKLKIEDFLLNRFRNKENVYLDQNNFINAIPEQNNDLLDEGVFTVIPMIIKSEVVGLLLFGLKHSGSQFGGKDIELLNAVCNQAAISIENARLYEAESEKIKYDKEMELAYNIQQNLLPRHIPHFEGLEIFGKMIPALRVGGDYFDVIPISNKKLFIALGDVSGKGVSASFFMTKLQTILQFICSAEKEPKDILVTLNEKIFDVIERDSFITLNLALIDLEQKKMKFCRAGHLPLYHVTENGLSEVKPRGLGLGLNKGDKFGLLMEQVEIPLGNNELICFISDGITETMNFSNDLFTEERFKELIVKGMSLHPEEIFNLVLDELTIFRGKTEQHDDITALILKTGNLD